MNIWYTADQHFDHGAIIQYCDRPFPFEPGNVKDMLRAVMRMNKHIIDCLLYTSPSPRDRTRSRMPSSA